MTVLYDHQIFSSQPRGGVSRYFTELLADEPGFTARHGWGFSVNVHLSEALPGRYTDWAKSWKFKGKAHLTGLWNRLVCIEALKGSDWDVFHPTYYDPYFLPYLGGRPFVLTIHDMTHELHPEGLSDASVTPGRKARLARAAAMVIAVSENTRRDAIRLLGLDPEKVVTIPHGNSLAPGRVQPVEPALSQPYWLYVGSRDGYKNWTTLVNALGLRNDPSERLVMVGGGPLTRAENDLLASVGWQGRYLQTSASEGELAGWYAGALGLVYPSLYEGFGLPLVAAMAWGCPVVAAEASCLPEVAGDAALWFDPLSPPRLADALARVREPNLRSELVKRGAVQCLDYTWDRTRTLTRAVYRQVLGASDPKGVAS